MGCLCLSCLDFMARVLLALWLVLLICVVSWCLFVFVLLLCMLFSVVVNSVGYFTLLIDVVFVLLYCIVYFVICYDLLLLFIVPCCLFWWCCLVGWFGWLGFAYSVKFGCLDCVLGGD